MKRNLKRRGSNVIEFAFTLPIVVGLLTGIMDYGWFFSQQQAVVQAARVGARRAAVSDPETEDATTVAKAAANQVLTDAGLSGSRQIDVTFAGAAPDAMVTVRVVVAYDGLAKLVPTPSSMGSSITSRLEQQ